MRISMFILHLLKINITRIILHQVQPHCTKRKTEKCMNFLFAFRKMHYTLRNISFQCLNFKFCFAWPFVTELTSLPT